MRVFQGALAPAAPLTRLYLCGLCLCGAALVLSACDGGARSDDRGAARAAEQARAAELTNAAAKKTPPAEVAKAPAPIPREAVMPKPWLWTATVGEKKSTIFATIKGGVGLSEALGSAGDSALRAARVVVLATDVSGVDAAAALERGRLPKGGSLIKLVTASTATYVAGELKAFPAAELVRMRPWMLAPVLSNDHLLGLSRGAPAMEVELRGKVDGARLRYLEKFADELDAYDRVPDACHGRMLDALVADADRGFAAMDGFTAAYRSGDEAALLRALKEDDPAQACATFGREVWGAPRTTPWLAPLERELAAGGAFIALDAHALLGPGGLLEVLRGRGVALSR